MTLNHLVDGEGPVVVLSGSLGSTLEMWDPQVPALAEHFRVIRYDHPGHGGSPLAETRTIGDFVLVLLALLDELGLDRVSFCGLSLGGAVGMQLALVAPERLDRLVLCCTSMRFATREFWDERIAAVRTDGVEAVADVVLKRWFTPEFPDVRRYREMLVSTPTEGYARACQALREWDARGRLGDVRAPTLAIAGEDDPSTPPAELEAIVGEIDGARLVVLEHARHLANVERAPELNDAVLAHLDA